MPLAEDMKVVVDNIVSSYESRIQRVGDLFDTTHQILQGFQVSLLDTKQEREKINTELRENLARNESLRRKDFDKMMQVILSNQDEREKEVRSLLNSYLGEQKAIAQTLRKNLEKFKGSIARGEAQRLNDFQDMIKEVLARQDERKREVISKLKEFQKEQQVIAKTLKELLAKGKELRIKDFKSMLKEFKVQRKKQTARYEERKKEVHSMLGDFKKERAEAVRNWQALQEKTVQKKG